jgi:hypothetical protein
VEILGPREEVMKQPIKPVARPGPMGSSVTLVPRPVNRADQGGA